MPTRFNETKAAELAAYFLQKSGGEMFLLKLLKLLYIAERESIRETGRSITCDRFVSMDHGPVLSRTLNLMNGTVQGGGSWTAMIAPRNGHKLSITDESEVAFDELSERELEIADRVFEKYGHVPRFELADLTHQFGEWHDPKGSSIPIEFEEILTAVGYDSDEIDALREELSEQRAMDAYLEAV